MFATCCRRKEKDDDCRPASQLAAERPLLCIEEAGTDGGDAEAGPGGCGISASRKNGNGNELGPGRDGAYNATWRVGVCLALSRCNIRRRQDDIVVMLCAYIYFSFFVIICITSFGE